VNEKYAGYCGLCCENCAVRVKINPASKVLFNEMKAAGFAEIIHFIPNGDVFWSFLKNMAENGTCTSCREGSGNPGCTVRICAKEKGIEMCALCEDYPCGHFDEFFKGYPILQQDNALLREKGMEAWLKLQDERHSSGFTYTDEKARLKNSG
jgi:hypothetical protein